MMKSNPRAIKVKRVYEPPSPDDGLRILVDRLWPRGLSKEKASIDEWMKEIAPSPELRRWFCHQPDLYAQFSEHYERELSEDPARQALVNRIRDLAAKQAITLVYAARDPVHNHAVLLQRWLNRQ